MLHDHDLRGGHFFHLETVSEHPTLLNNVLLAGDCYVGNRDGPEGHTHHLQRVGFRPNLDRRAAKISSHWIDGEIPGARPS